MPKTLPNQLTKTSFEANEDRLKEVFLQFRDPVGYEFAVQELGSFEEIERLLQYDWFKQAWSIWQDDLRASIKSKALARIQEISEEGSAQSLNAAKYLANGEYIEGVTKRGRPSKEEVTGELKRQVKAIDELNDDFKRMTAFTVVKGGKK